MQNQNDNNERVRPKLESAADLKGGRAKAKARKSIGKRRTVTVIALLLVLALVAGAYYAINYFKPVVVEEEPTSSLETVRLIEREKVDLDRLTIYVNGEKTYTIVSNLAQKAALEAAATATAAPVAEATPAPEAEAGSASDAVKEVLEDVVGTLDVAGNLSSELPSPSPESTALPTPEELAALSGTDTALSAAADATAAPGATEAPATEAPAAEAVQETVLPDYEIEGMPWFTVNPDIAKGPCIYSYAFTASKLIEEGCTDLSKYGLDTPQIQVVYLYHDGTETTLNVGNKVVAGSYYYVTIDDSTDVYMAYANVYRYHTYDLAALHAVPVLATIASDSINDITITQRGKETIQMSYIENSDTNMSVTILKLVQPFYYDTNSERATEIMESSGALAITAYAGYAPDEASKALYGLNDPFASVDMTDTNGVHLTFVIGDTVAGGQTYRYVTVDETGNVYTIDVSLLAYLENVRASYVVDQFSNLVYIKKITGYEIEANDTVYTAAIERTDIVNEEGEPDTEETFFYEGAQTDEDLFKDFYQIVVGTLFDKRMENEEDYHFDGEVYCTVRYHMTFQDEPFVVEYLDYDRDYYAIRRDGLTLFLIRKDKIQNMVATAEQYRNGEYLGNED